MDKSVYKRQFEENKIIGGLSQEKNCSKYFKKT